MTDIYQEIARTIADGEEAALVTIISAKGSTPRKEGAKMLVKTDGSVIDSIGGGSSEAQAVDMAMEVIKTGKPQQFNISLNAKEGEPGMICGGEVEVFVEPIMPPAALYIFGGGHVSLPVSRIGKCLGFKVVVIDDREEYVNPERFPEAEIILVEDFSDVLSKLKLAKSSYMLIITRNHQTDELVLEQVLKTQPRYVGLMGSQNKIKTIFAHLVAKGISQEQLDKVYTPIGLDIHAQTPEEIAISILAEIIKVRRSQNTEDRQ